jgi:hypothetical protein
MDMIIVSRATVFQSRNLKKLKIKTGEKENENQKI